MRRENRKRKRLRRREERKEGRKEREREGGWERKKREEIDSAESCLYETSSSDIIEEGRRPVKDRSFTDLYPNKSSLFIKQIASAFKELIFQ